VDSFLSGRYCVLHPVAFLPCGLCLISVLRKRGRPTHNRNVLSCKRAQIVDLRPVGNRSAMTANSMLGLHLLHRPIVLYRYQFLHHLNFAALHSRLVVLVFLLHRLLYIYSWSWITAGFTYTPGFCLC